MVVSRILAEVPSSLPSNLLHFKIGFYQKISIILHNFFVCKLIEILLLLGPKRNFFVLYALFLDTTKIFVVTFFPIQG